MPQQYCVQVEPMADSIGKGMEKKSGSGAKARK